MTTQTQDVLFEVQDHIGVITLNRPDRLNALSPVMQDSIRAVMDRMREDREVRCLVLIGTGRGFCAGGDVGSLTSRSQGAEEGPSWLPPRTDRDVVLLMRECDKPIIGAINGYAVGWGLGLACATDIRIASEEAKFGAFWTRRGLMGDGGGTYFLPRILGTSRALEIILTGALIDAHEAERIGLVSKVVPHQRLLDEALDLARRIAAMPPLAVALDKRAVYRSMEVSLAEALAFEHIYQQRLFQTEDFKEGMRAYNEKREPRFTGR